MAGRYSTRKHKKFMKSQGFSGSDIQYVRNRKPKKKRSLKRANPNATVRGWVRAKAVKIVRDKKGRAVSVKIKT
jgi:hypothetical protein